MRRKRIKADGEGIYHVVSRIAGRAFRLEGGEGRALLGEIRRAAAFSGVEVYTFAMMGNHFHLLVRVPEKREVGEEELARRLVALYGVGGYGKIASRWAEWAEKGQAGRVEEEKAKFRARMGDLSEFVKTFKEAYSKDYNRRHGYTGSIWEGRFKSVLVEASQEALMAVAGYIHMNPVRAGMAGSAEEAPNTGYGRACAGEAEARAGLMALAGRLRGRPVGWTEARAAFGDGVRGEYATRRIPGFTAGGALGGVAFTAAVAERCGAKRQGGHGVEGAGLALASAFRVRAGG